MKSSETKQQFVELRASGITYQKIAEELQVSKQTLINWSRELNDDLENYMAIERDHVLRQFLLVKDSRQTTLGSTFGLARKTRHPKKRKSSYHSTEPGSHSRSKTHTQPQRRVGLQSSRRQSQNQG